MKDKILVLDIDGTLMPANNEIDEETKMFLNDFEQQNTVVLCSGRGFHNLKLIHDKLELKGPIISNNGGTLHFFDGKSSVCMSIDTKIIKELFDNFKEIIISSYYSYENDLYIYNKLPELSFLYKIEADSNVIEGAFNEIKIVNPNNVYFILKNDLKESFFKYVDDNFSDEVTIEEYGHDAKVSIVILKLKNTDKSYAILELLLLNSKKEEDLIIFGDAEVDISMLSLEGHTVAMLNASDEVKAHAKYVTKFDNNNQGVLRYMKELLRENDEKIID